MLDLDSSCLLEPRCVICLNESELARLRAEINLMMKSSVSASSTTSAASDITKTIAQNYVGEYSQATSYFQVNLGDRDIHLFNLPIL